MTPSRPSAGFDGEGMKAGYELDPATYEPSKLDLLEYAIVSRDPNLIHHDPEFARASGLPDVIVQGTLKAGLLALFVEERVGGRWRIAELAVQYRGVDVVSTPLTAHGRVVAVDEPAGTMSLDVWLQSPTGAANTRASVTLEQVG
jgi:acyl dehydratase